MGRPRPQRSAGELQALGGDLHRTVSAVTVERPLGDEFFPRMPSLRPPFSALWGVTLAVVGASAGCTRNAGLPPVPIASLVPITGHRIPAAAEALRPVSTGSGAHTVLAVGAFPLGSGVGISGVRDGPPARFVAVLLDDRLWCPRSGRTGRSADLPAPVQALDPATIASIDVARDSAAAPYARRCAEPVDAVLRIRTRAAGRR